MPGKVQLIPGFHQILYNTALRFQLLQIMSYSHPSKYSIRFMDTVFIQLIYVCVYKLKVINIDNDF